jgi:hypothetical protein
MIQIIIAQMSIENSHILDNFHPKPLIDCESEEYFGENCRDIGLEYKKK